MVTSQGRQRMETRKSSLKSNFSSVEGRKDTSKQASKQVRRTSCPLFATLRWYGAALFSKNNQRFTRNRTSFTQEDLSKRSQKVTSLQNQFSILKQFSLCQEQATALLTGEEPVRDKQAETDGEGTLLTDRVCVWFGKKYR